MNQTRYDLLADVADMYYLQGQNQAEIARQIGVTRSMISKMLTEARSLGIVKIRIERPIQYNHELSEELAHALDLSKVKVVVENPGVNPHKQLGAAGARYLGAALKTGTTLGIPWGTTVSAVVEALEVDHPLSVKIVQLVGALDARNQEYDGHALVQRLVEKLGGEGYYLNAPFYSEDPSTAAALLKNKGVQDSLRVAGSCDMALLGIGTTHKKYSSFYVAGYIDDENFEKFLSEDVVGDVCGLHFDIEGRPRAREFEKRTVNVGRERLLQIPRRIGVAAGSYKAAAIIGAARSHYINELVTNNVTAHAVLEKI